MMTPELKQKWVDALRSGKYQQGKSYLRRKENNYCCLGVLCDIYDGDIWCDGEQAYELKGSDGCFGTLTDGLRREFNLVEEEEVTLACMNDDQNKSFTEIADYIEANL